MRRIPLLLMFITANLFAGSDPLVFVFRPQWVFDGYEMHEKYEVSVSGSSILHIGPVGTTPASKAKLNVLDLPGKTLLPGLIDAHTHVLLHPYDETAWNDQVLKESQAVRVIRAVNHLRWSVQAGFTTLRDLGSEGAGYADVGIKQALEQGLIPGPRLLVAGRAIVATGSYGPKGFAVEWQVPLGAQPADGNDLIAVTRDQIGKGADWVKVYADYRWGPNGETRPSFSLEELQLIVATAASGGRKTVAHASSAEAMRRAVLAGVKSIEHGDGGTVEVFALMNERGVVFCPTLAAGESISRYRGWNKRSEMQTPDRILNKRASFKLALDSGVTIALGSDAGVFAHGGNALEIELLVEYGMAPVDALRAATSVNADLLDLTDRVGRLKRGLAGDMVLVEGNPFEDISVLRKPLLVLKDGRSYLDKTGREVLKILMN